MKIYKEIELKNFEAWSGAVDTMETLTEEQLDQLEFMLEAEVGDDGWDDDSLNDFLWFETDTIAEWLGFRDWEDLERHNNGEEEWEELESKDVLDEDGFWTEYTLWQNEAATRFVCIFGDKDMYTPYDDDFDAEFDIYEEAKNWFDNYEGFAEDED